MPNFKKDDLENCGADASGWLSPEGVFWQCGFSEHSKLAEWYLTKRTKNNYYKKIEDPEQTFENIGWVKISNGSIRYISSGPNKKQLDILAGWWMKYHPKNNRSVNYKSLGLEEFLSYASLARRLNRIAKRLEEVNINSFSILEKVASSFPI